MKKILSLLLITFTIVTACDTMDEINTDPNLSTTVPPSFLSNNIILNATSFSSGKWLLEEAWIMKTQSFTEHFEEPLYNKFNRESFSSYHNLVDAQKMLDLVNADATINEGVRNSYEGLYHFMRAFFFFEARIKIGVIPCRESWKGETEGVFMSKYDTQ
mgnify:FL=1